MEEPGLDADPPQRSSLQPQVVRSVSKCSVVGRFPVHLFKPAGGREGDMFLLEQEIILGFLASACVGSFLGGSGLPVFSDAPCIPVPHFDTRDNNHDALCLILFSQSGPQGTQL